VQNNLSRETNRSSATPENTNRKQRTRQCVHTIPQLVVIVSQTNLLHAFQSCLVCLHFYTGISQAVYAQPPINLQMRCLMQTFLKLASNPKTFMNESQFSRCLYNSQLVNTGHTDRIIAIMLPPVGFFGILADVLDIRDGNLVSLELQTRNSKACNDLTVQWKYFRPSQMKAYSFRLSLRSYGLYQNRRRPRLS